ncbi:hypothetical protein [Parasitella parasitica]|uniref:Cora-domain-containing protein n=1 Tax=Parasitella parasitica TaxID=35722 RepID=A0A0B7NQM5_9FUNG|nr:hypothetical protein [Parasitella parasitica]
MEDKRFQARSFLAPSVSQDYVLQMEPVDSTASTPPAVATSSTNTTKGRKNSTDVEVCYPYPTQQPDQHSTLETEVLKSYIQNSKSDEVNDPEYQLERQLTAKLDDLLDSGQNEPSSASRRFSLYGDNVRNPSEVNRDIDRYTFYSAELGSLKNRSFRQLLLTKSPSDDQIIVADLLTETTSWWIDIFAPSNDEMRVISKIFRIHPLTTEDIQAQESREKCEIFQNYMFISFRSFNHDFNSPDYLEAVSFYIVIFKDGVLTFRFQDLPHPHNVRRRIHQLKDFIHVTPEWINYALIDNITDSFAPLIQHTELEVDSIDDLVLVLNGSEQNDMLRRIGSCRKTVMQLLRLLGPKADVVRSLIKRYEDKAKEIGYNNMRLREPGATSGTLTANHTTSNNITAVADIVPEQDEVKVHHEVTLYLGDIQDHILTMLQNVNHYDLILGRAHRNYLGQISIELSQAGNTTNEVINRLTFFATIIVPLNLVGGLFGMNVHVPGQNNEDLVWFFWIVLGMLLYVVAMLAIGKRTGFL